MKRALLCLALAGCGVEDPFNRMYEQQKEKPQAGAMRSPPAGTVARERQLELEHGAPAMTMGLLEKGRHRYDVACAPCHGFTGEGDTVVASRLAPRPPPSLHEARVREKSDESVFVAISQGAGPMPAFPDIPVEERWGVVGYVRALQLSQRTQLSEAPLEVQARLEERSPMTPFTGGRTLMLAANAVGVLGLVLTAVGILQAPELALSSILLAFTYWTGLAMASLLIVALFNAAGARWITVIRRQLEHHAAALVPCAAAFVTLAVGVKRLYVWADPSLVAKLGPHTQHLLEHKRVWLNAPGYAVRGALCLVLFLGVWWLLDRASRAQETRPPDERLRSQTRGISAGALPFLALAMTVGAVDWLMSLEPEWFSAIFGVYWFAGSLVSAFALVLLVVIVPSDPNLPAAKASNEHVATLATLVFAFSCLWAYVAYSQYLIIWQANVPEETAWLFARGLFSLAKFHRGIDPPTSAAQFAPEGYAWFPLTALLILGRFVLPFLFLLSYRMKRHRKFLTALCVWVLTMQFVDLFWVIKPALRLRSAELAAPAQAVMWTDFTAWVGLGGLCVAFVLFRMRGRHAMPVNDPTLEESLRYQQPMA